jgi:IS5 family transposase
MRKKIVAQRSLFDHAINLLISIFKPEKKLKKMSAIIDANPDIVAAVHGDLTEGSADSGSHGISAEQVLRCAVLKQYKQYCYRELWERLKDGVSFRWFTRFYSDPIPHYTTLQKAIKSIKAQTWTRINEALICYAQERKLERGKSLRVDTTVVGTNTAYPLPREQEERRDSVTVSSWLKGQRPSIIARGFTKTLSRSPMNSSLWAKDASWR